MASKNPQKSSKNPQKSPKNLIFHFPHVCRRSIRSKPCFYWCSANFHHIFGCCSQYRVALISGYYLIKFRLKLSTGGWDRSRSVSLTEHVFPGVLAHFRLLLPHALTQSNEICNQSNPTLELLSPKISAKMVHVAWDTDRGIRSVKHVLSQLAWFGLKCFYWPHIAKQICDRRLANFS